MNNYLHNINAHLASLQEALRVAATNKDKELCDRLVQMSNKRIDLLVTEWEELKSKLKD